MATHRISLARARANIGVVSLVLVAVQTLLLYLTTGVLPIVGTIYGCSLLCGTGAERFVGVIAALIGAAMFALPTLIGVFSRSWRSALVLAALPWWIVVLAHAGTLLSPYIGLAANGPGGRFDGPFWLNPTRLTLLLASLALFLALGILGWLARRVFAGEPAA